MIPGCRSSVLGRIAKQTCEVSTITITVPADFNSKVSPPLNVNATAGNPRQFRGYWTVATTLPPETVPVFSTGTLIDSGTVITRLPAAAYTAMRDAFREGMKRYGEPKTVEGVLDTCYDLRAYNLETVSFPAVAFTFSGGLTLELKSAGTVIVIVDTSQVCLAILPNTEDRQPGIIGNFQQKGFEVVYDVAGGKIGFAARSC
ncbi:aspartyl protease family protein At5g10770-like [Pyrus communis]|uniref:aspartyl protease family protein At5g10770-like n=1 Tax=Pyrus communis TaxID=23211 RepID=UPI0035BF08A7